jgi:hypothetical protein
MKFLVIDGCPCPAGVAPYVYIVLRDAGQTASSIYRGDDARTLLHRLGKRTQREIHADPALAAISNPPGFSQHELFSDGVGNPHVPRGGRLQWWQVGVDSGTDDQAAQDRITHAASRNGWHVDHPYSRGVEGHHWCFRTQPKAKGLRQRLRVRRVRRMLTKQAPR